MADYINAWKGEIAHRLRSLRVMNELASPDNAEFFLVRESEIRSYHLPNVTFGTLKLYLLSPKLNNRLLNMMVRSLRYFFGSPLYGKLIMLKL